MLRDISVRVSSWTVLKVVSCTCVFYSCNSRSFVVNASFEGVWLSDIVFWGTWLFVLYYFLQRIQQMHHIVVTKATKTTAMMVK